MLDLTIVMPLGVSTPGTPVLKYLKTCVEGFKNQKTKFNFDLQFSCDINVDQEIKNFLIDTGYKINWYEPFYYMRKGGIWKKIYDRWLVCDSKYVAFTHYDDYWSDNKIESQLNLMESKNLEFSWSKVSIINESDEVVSGDLSYLSKLSKDTLRTNPTYAFSHSCIFNKNSILNSGILNKIDKCISVYENLQFLYCHKLNGYKDENSTFYHRTHGDSISNNFVGETNLMKQQRLIANYSLDEVLKDENEINLRKIMDEIDSCL